MTSVLYALAVRDEHDTLLAVVGTSYEALTKHGKMAPAIPQPCKELLSQSGAARVEVVKWERGMDLEAAPMLLIVSASREQPGMLTYQVMEVETKVQV